MKKSQETLGTTTSSAQELFNAAINGDESPPYKLEPTSEVVLIDGINLNDLKLTQDFGADLGVKTEMTLIPVRRPKKTEFYRIRDERIGLKILEIKEENDTEIYLCAPNVVGCVNELVRAVAIFPAINRTNNVFLITIPLPQADGRRNSWHQSLDDACTMAVKKWVRVVANKSMSGYDVVSAVAPLPEPEWPDKTLGELISIAFRDRVIKSLDHPVIQRLLGKV